MPIRGTRSSSIHNTGPSPSTRKPSKGTAVAAKSLQSCLTLCDSIDGSPPGSPVPGILQARTLSHQGSHLMDTTLFSWSYDSYLEKAMAPHSSTPAWKIPGTGEPGGLQSMGSLRVGHD